ncbi:hypothetical protein [Tomitella fengzijianii]|uniref:hypothetical protein n=1 Tax=Tomitella fengzijianii TaxID=2597660 RepID=UPI0020C071BC|nr:hypothetical protein [Tomitella fengzijianii]
MKPRRQLSRGQLLADAMDGIPRILPEHQAAATRTVCANADGADDARELLAMLGLPAGTA